MGSYQVIKGHPVCMLSLRNKPVTRNPVIEDIVEEQARAIFLFDIGLIRPAAAEVPDSNRDQRVTLRGCRVLLGHSGEYMADIPAHYSQY